MKKQIPIILLGIVCVALVAWGLYRSKTENAHLKSEIAGLKAAEPLAAPKPTLEAKPSAVVRSAEEPEGQPLPVEEVAASEAKKTSSRRKLKSMAAEVMDNPAMSKALVASQRGVVGTLYSDLLEYLDLNHEETEYFMDLLMSREMKIIELVLNLMTDELSDEEKKVLTDELTEAEEIVKEEMEIFLNNPEDFAEWEFYEKTMDERKMLSQFDQKLSAADAMLSDEAYRELLGMLHEEKENFPFTSNLHDDENMDLSAERFSTENLQNFANDLERLNENITQRAQDMLTPEQFSVFSESLKTTTEIQQSQMEMAKQMFFGDSEK